MSNIPEIIIDPDCSTGKHGNCNGTGWNLDLDCVDICPCVCHEVKPINLEVVDDRKNT